MVVTQQVTVAHTTALFKTEPCAVSRYGTLVPTPADPPRRSRLCVEVVVHVVTLATDSHRSPESETDARKER